jgi:hypothetical protein
MNDALRILLEGLVDYAGLFPPAALPMELAVQNYARYRESDHAWMLGRFVVPGDRTGDVPAGFPLSILGMPFPSAHTFEVKAGNVGEIERIAAEAGGATVYVEITDLALVPALAAHGLRAKFRTGGVTPEAFPDVEQVAGFLRACRTARVPFKATAGLHHPLRCVKPLTYEANAPQGTMHGFLNVFLAAGFAGFEADVLRETDPAAFEVEEDGISWRGYFLSRTDLRALRNFAVSFGSCSFEEPVEDLRALGLL